MGILNTEMNYDSVLKDLGVACLTEETCGPCTNEECLVGYAKTVLSKCFKDNVTYVENGIDGIPSGDLKVYREEDFIDGIAHILKQCKSCQEDHFENCLINVIRSCYEIILFGENQEYKGSAFRYLNQIHSINPELTGHILEVFHGKE